MMEKEPGGRFSPWALSLDLYMVFAAHDRKERKLAGRLPFSLLRARNIAGPA